MSETINVVIEISAELYAYHKYGIPLSEVLAEIESEIEKDSKEWLGLDFYDGIYRAIAIIDKHMDKGGKEVLEKSAGIEQIIWERDLAIQQLKSLGYGLGEKPKENKGDSNGEWIPIKTRPLTEEEKEYYAEHGAYYFDSIFDCHLPEDGQEVMITTNNGSVDKVTFYDEGDDGSYFEGYEDEGEVLAWQPTPEPYKGESEDK